MERQGKSASAKCDGLACTVRLHVGAPEKPAFGAGCNGCGVCCALEPCPVAGWALFQFRGACRALTWDATGERYVCGLLSSPSRFLVRLPRFLEPVVRRLVARGISAGSGCDCDAEVG